MAKPQAKSVPHLKMVVDNSSKKFYEEEEWLGLIIAGINRRIRQGLTMKYIAEAVGVSPGTISRLIDGITVHPRQETVSKIMKYLGYRLLAEI